MNLGYCVVFDHAEQGWDGRTVIVTDTDLQDAINLVEILSHYPANHERYKQEVFDLTKMYHRLALEELDPKLLAELKSYSPEAYHAIVGGYTVDETVQSYRPLGTRCWINRRFEEVALHIEKLNHEAALKRERK